MGRTNYLKKTVEKVKTDMSLQVLAYNMKSMINIFGIKPLMQIIKGYTRRSNTRPLVSPIGLWLIFGK